MNLSEALEKATRILEEEQVQPTLGYRYVSDAWPSNLWYQRYDLEAKGWTPAMAAVKGLVTERDQRPRQVYEDPKLYALESVNFNLLLKVFSQVADADRESFVSALLKYVRQPMRAVELKPKGSYPRFQG